MPVVMVAGVPALPVVAVTRAALPVVVIVPIVPVVAVAVFAVIEVVVVAAAPSPSCRPSRRPNGRLGTSDKQAAERWAGSRRLPQPSTCSRRCWR